MSELVKQLIRASGHTAEMSPASVDGLFSAAASEIDILIDERDELRQKVKDAEYWAKSRGETIDWDHYHKMRVENDADVKAREASHDND